MKKLFIFVAIIGMLTLVSCGNKGVENENTSIDHVYTDSPDTIYIDTADTICTDARSAEQEEQEIENDDIYSSSVDPDIIDNVGNAEEIADEEWDQFDVPDVLDYFADYDDWDSDWSDISDSDDSEVVSWIAPQSDIHYGFTDDEVAEIARIVWLEVGICSCDYYTQYLTACVILNRYLDWGYGSLYEVIHASGQYATADMYTEYDGSAIRIGERTWSAVYDALADTDRNPHYQMRGGAGMPVYYWDTEWDVCFYY